MTEEAVPQQLREEYVVRKFGGVDPDALRPEDLVEEITIVIEGGAASHTITYPGAPPETT